MDKHRLAKKLTILSAFFITALFLSLHVMAAGIFPAEYAGTGPSYQMEPLEHHIHRYYTHNYNPVLDSLNNKSTLKVRPEDIDVGTCLMGC